MQIRLGFSAALYTKTLSLFRPAYHQLLPLQFSGKSGALEKRSQVDVPVLGLESKLGIIMVNYLFCISQSDEDGLAR